MDSPTYVVDTAPDVVTVGHSPYVGGRLAMFSPTQLHNLTRCLDGSLVIDMPGSLVYDLAGSLVEDLAGSLVIELAGSLTGYVRTCLRMRTLSLTV